jgi:hypothetical protein
MSAIFTSARKKLITSSDTGSPDCARLSAAEATIATETAHLALAWPK